MGQLLFWLEAMIASVLFVALGTALVSRVQRRGRRWLLRIAWLLVATLPWVCLISSFALVEIKAGGAIRPLISSSVAFGLFIIAAVVVAWRGRRRSSDATGSAAGSWRLSRVVLAWVAVVVLACVTFWRLDLAVRRAMAATRAEACAIALSISPPQIPDSENAALLYCRAWETLDAQGTVTVVAEPSPLLGFGLDYGMGVDFDEPEPPQPDGDVPPTEEVSWDRAVARWLYPQEYGLEVDEARVQEFLRSRAPVIELLHQAAKLPGCDFGVRYNPPSLEVFSPSLGRMRSLNRLQLLSARVAADEGRIGDAMVGLNASYALAAHLKVGPPLIDCLVSAAVDDASFDTFQYVLDRAPMTDEACAAMELDGSENSNAALHRSMRMEKATGLFVFGELNEMDVSGLGADPPATGAFAAPYRVFLWEADKAAYMRWMSTYEALSSRPYYENAQTWQAPEAVATGGLLTHMLPPNYYYAVRFVASADAKHRLVELAVAMWRYRLAHGAFPDQLDQLVPEYVPAVPVDPCTGQPMKLLRTEDQLMIYSVGPDGRDDGGESTDSIDHGDIALVLSR